MKLATLSPKDAQALGLVALLGIVVVYVVGKKLATAGAGLVTGNNAITQNQVNAAGEKTTAYEGAGVVGTVGAVANSASGGVFASWGENLGGWVYELTHDDPLATPPASTSTGGATGGW